MTIYAFNDFFQIISDGEKIIFLRVGGGKRECIVYVNSCLERLNINISRPIDVQEYGREREFTPGLIDCSVDLSLRGGEIRCIDRPLIMGVDIFNRLSVTDYLDIINQKIKGR